jgi:hypothetical protein
MEAATFMSFQEQVKRQEASLRTEALVRIGSGEPADTRRIIGVALYTRILQLVLGAIGMSGILCARRLCPLSCHAVPVTIDGRTRSVPSRHRGVAT